MIYIYIALLLATVATAYIYYHVRRVSIYKKYVGLRQIMINTLITSFLLMLFGIYRMSLMIKAICDDRMSALYDLGQGLAGVSLSYALFKGMFYIDNHIKYDIAKIVGANKEKYKVDTVYPDNIKMGRDKIMLLGIMMTIYFTGEIYYRVSMQVAGESSLLLIVIATLYSIITPFVRLVSIITSVERRSVYNQ